MIVSDNGTELTGRLVLHGPPRVALRLGPHERLGVLTVALDEGIDMLVEMLLDRRERSAGQRLPLQDPDLLIYDHAAPNLTLLPILHAKANLTAEILMRPSP